MTWLARLLADEDFRDGAVVIGVVVAAVILVVALDKVALWLFPNTPKGAGETFEAAGIEITNGPQCPDIVADANQKPHYLNGCACEDCVPWVPTDDEIAAFIAGRREGGDVR